jgi:hypothetical protein
MMSKVFISYSHKDRKWKERLPKQLKVVEKEGETAMLDEAWNGGEINAVTLTAWGGVGKTARVNHWLNRMSTDRFRGAEKGNKHLLSIALDYLTLGRAWTERARKENRGDPHAEPWKKATDFLDRAVTGLREAGDQDMLVLGLLARAAFY